MRPHTGALRRRAIRNFLAILALGACAGALAQTPVVATTHTVVEQGEPPAVEHDFTVTNAGSYSVTVTDLGSKLPSPAPLASVAMAVTQGGNLVGTPVAAPGTAITFNAAANTQYTIHVVGVPGAALGSGPIEEDVTDSSGNNVFSSIDSLASPAQQPGTAGILTTALNVQTSGPYTIALTDLQFPAALQASALLLIDNTTGSSVALSNPPSTSFQDTVTLTAGDAYQIVAYGIQAAQTGGLFGVAVTPASGAAIYSDIVPVGAVTLLSTSVSGTAQNAFTLGSGAATLSLTDLSFPTVPLSSAGAILVDATTQTAAASVTGTGSQVISTPSTSDSYQVYAYAVADSTANWGSYSVAVQQGTSFPFLESRAVSTPGSSIQAFSLDTRAPAAGSYVITLTDFKFPASLAADALVAVQDGQIVKSINAAGNFTASLAAGPVTLLAFGEEGSGSSPGLMGVDLSPAAGGGPVFDVTEGVGTGFSSSSFTVTSAQAVQADVADLKFPTPLANLNLAVTSGTTLVGSIASAGSSGSFPFTAAANTTYNVNVLAQPATPANSQQSAAGTYAMSVDAAPVVTLSAGSTSVASGGTVSLTWSSQNATSCTASASPSNSAWSGSENTSGGPMTTSALTATTTFSLSCAGGGGSSSASVTVSVTAAPASGGHGGGGAIDLELLLALAAMLSWRRRAIAGRSAAWPARSGRP